MTVASELKDVFMHKLFLLHVKDCVGYAYTIMFVSEGLFSVCINSPRCIASDEMCACNLRGLQGDLREGLGGGGEAETP